MRQPGGLGRDTDTGLTRVQRDTLAQLAAGASNNDIAKAAGITRDAAKDRVKYLCVVLGAENRHHAVAIARRRGLAPADGPRHDEGGASADR